MRYVLFFIAAMMLTGCDGFIEEDISDESVEVIAPANGVEIKSRNINFAWDLMEGATSYRLLVVSPSFEKAERVMADTLVGGRLYNLTVDSDGDYEWSIKAVNSAYDGTTDKYKFVVKTTLYEE